MLQKIQSQIMKHKLLVAIGLLIFIVASSSRAAMHSTALGKTVLVALVIALAYVHKIAGLVAVIFLIVLYQSQYGGSAFYYNSPYMPYASTEGFTITDASGNTKTVTVSGKPPPLKFDISGNLDIMPPPPPPTSSQSTTQGQGQEGFDLLGTEDTMRKGKQSNTINVKKNMSQSGSLLPFENTKYVENFLVLGG